MDDGRPVSLWPPTAPSSDPVTVDEYDYDGAAEFAEATVDAQVEAPGITSGKGPCDYESRSTPGALRYAIEDHEDLPASRRRTASGGTALRWCRSSCWRSLAYAGILGPVCEAAGVPLIATKGYSSLTLNHGLHTRMQAAAGAWRWRLLCVFDHDSSGDGIPAAVVRDLDRFDRWIVDDDPDANPAAWDWERIALTEDQIAEFDLPTRPPKRAGDPERRCEVDALPPGYARGDRRGKAITNLYPADLPERRVGGGAVTAQGRASGASRGALSRRLSRSGSTRCMRRPRRWRSWRRRNAGTRSSSRGSTQRRRGSNDEETDTGP